MTRTNRLFGLIAALLPASVPYLSVASAQHARNPIIHADVPDVSMVRVGDAYYMSSTTMHMSPGLPIMKSKDLVNWELLNYAYDRLGENDELNLAEWPQRVRPRLLGEQHPLPRRRVLRFDVFRHDRQDLHLSHQRHRERTVGGDLVRAVAARLVALLRR